MYLNLLTINANGVNHAGNILKKVEMFKYMLLEFASHV